VTGGISAGRGVVSMRVVWLNLKLRLISPIPWGSTILGVELTWAVFPPS
jgi:hypothetical protein